MGTSLDAATPTARDDFWYGPDGDRYLRKETWQSGSTQHSRWVLYLQGGTFEEVRTPNDPTVDFYQKVQVTPTIQYRLTRTKAGATSFTYDYLHRDHLGSVDRVTNSTGALVHRISSDAFGARREGLWNSDLTSASLATLLADNSKMTGRGFTDHEHLDRTGIIHMNGRIYDPRIGRFLQPDPIVADPADSQSYNRYSYVGNQPLVYTDPSGFQKVEEVITHGSRLGGNAAATANFAGGQNLLPEGLKESTVLVDNRPWPVSVKQLFPGDEGYEPPRPASKEEAKPKIRRWGAIIGGGSTAARASSSPTEMAGTAPETLLDLTERIVRGVGDVSEVVSNKTKWAKTGQIGEQLASEYLIANGYTILAEQLYVRTSVGLRITDFVVTGGKLGTNVAGFEVKVNGADRSPLQVLKDSMISTKGGTVVNWSQQNFARGTPVQYTTYLMYVDLQVR